MTNCEWCSLELAENFKSTRLFLLPLEDGQKKLYFHKKCLEEFKKYNPKIMLKKQQEALQK